MNLVSEERDCGCLLGNNTVTKEVFISYCSKHAAAPALYEALKFAKDLLEASYLWTSYVDEMVSPALELATGDSDE
jgi:hypothetical protein